jgi:hypothetical protein
MTSDEHWAVMCRARYLRDHLPVSYNLSSSIWHGLKMYVNTVHQYSTWTIGDGTKVLFWTDSWLPRAIVDYLNIPSSVSESLNTTVSVYILNGK